MNDKSRHKTRTSHLWQKENEKKRNAKLNQVEEMVFLSVIRDNICEASAMIVQDISHNHNHTTTNVCKWKSKHIPEAHKSCSICG